MYSVDFCCKSVVFYGDLKRRKKLFYVTIYLPRTCDFQHPSQYFVDKNSIWYNSIVMNFNFSSLNILKFSFPLFFFSFSNSSHYFYSFSLWASVLIVLSRWPQAFSPLSCLMSYLSQFSVFHFRYCIFFCRHSIWAHFYIFYFSYNHIMFFIMFLKIWSI